MNTHQPCRVPLLGSERSAAGTLSVITALLSLFAVSAAGAAEVDWNQVQGKVIKVLYPGVASLDFMKGADHGTGATPVATMKKACVDCHISKDGKYDINADKIVTGELKMIDSGEPLEPSRPAGMQGFKDVEIKAAYDAESIHLRFQWQGSGASVADASLARDGRADRLSVQINSAVQSFGKYGCWITCHDDQTDMPENRGKEVKLYTYFARKDGAAQPQDKLDGFRSKGQFVDLWIASFEGAKVKAEDEHILADRSVDPANVSASGGFSNGKYTVVLSRKLVTGDPLDIELKDGSVFVIGVSVHDNKNKGRKHYVSFPVSIGLATAADVAAHRL